jgi:hypothetical protein
MSANQPYILKFTQGTMCNRQFTLVPDEVYVLGSHCECEIRVDGDPTVSRRHACLKLDSKGVLTIVDLDSTNGTFVSGRRVNKSKRVQVSDTLRFGLRSLCELQPWNALESSLPPSLRTVAGNSRVPSRPASRQALQLTAPLWFTVAGFCVGGLGFGLWQAFENPNSGYARSVTHKFQITTEKLNRSMQEVRGNQKFFKERGAALNTERTDVPLVANDFIWDEIITISQRFGEIPPSAMDSGFVAEVEKWIQFYTKNNRHQHLLKKRDAAWSVIEKILKAYSLPPELGYIAWVESAFDSSATSHAGAVGVWQFISSTAREYGLSPLTGDSLDQRRHLEPSTHAAARYLNELLKQFGNRHYLLALAAYNAGQNKIKRHEISERIKRARRVDFWHLRDKLPKETQDYVPKVIAAIIIGRNPEFW